MNFIFYPYIQGKYRIIVNVQRLHLSIREKAYLMTVEIIDLYQLQATYIK